MPGRDIMVQGWYQGGVDVIDFTDPDHPFEIAFFDRGPVDRAAGAGRHVTAGADQPARAARSAARGARTTGTATSTRPSWRAASTSSSCCRATSCRRTRSRRRSSCTWTSTIRRASRRSCGRRRSRWCGRISISSCATTVLPSARTTAIASALDAAEAADGRRAEGVADEARDAGRWRRERRDGCDARARDGAGDQGSRRGDEVASS